jgi:hypothetical protein
VSNDAAIDLICDTRKARGHNYDAAIQPLPAVAVKPAPRRMSRLTKMKGPIV